ncbi:nuclear transport factor 2 family protein [Streptomyces sp. NPDC102402]|uniref:nuclear transport factor 2 family protein n=1 Tax=Streptomyces sp. NPDC102402 TaxID=3366169 RepID=UPI0037F7818F
MTDTSISEVTQLVLRERQSRDRGWYEQMAASCSADSHIEMSWFTGSGAEFTARTRAMADRGDIAVHRLGPPTVHVAVDRALAELPLIIEWRIDVDGVEADLASSCRSRYRARRETDGVWRIVAITSIYEKDTLTSVLPGTPLHLDTAELAAYRPSYRFLSWFLNRQGYPLTGDDRPGQVAEQYRSEFAWLHRTPTDPAA